jgi:tRNA (guanine-N7-)-methyltransferase
MTTNDDAATPASHCSSRWGEGRGEGRQQAPEPAVAPHPDPLPAKNGEREERDLRSYGRRRGRKPSARQAALLEHELPRVALSLSLPPPARLGDLFAPAVEEVWLEIGFGGGEHLLWQARANPHVGLIGCEPFEDGVVKALSAIEREKLANIRLYADDARPLLRWLPDAAIARGFILFPDPWPKKRHQKRRLVSPATLAELARIMRSGAELRVATDISDYARWILLAVREQKSFSWTAGGARDWRERGADWPSTRYEQKAIREGRRCSYFRFRRA